jgi:hypothetical protein
MELFVPKEETGNSSAQALAQLAAIGVTLAIASVGGAVTGNGFLKLQVKAFLSYRFSLTKAKGLVSQKLKVKSHKSKRLSLTYVTG